eukprot:scaffold1220_cov104-Skeletonema_dohrnii-CCMP3373.AAC.6
MSLRATILEGGLRDKPAFTMSTNLESDTMMLCAACGTAQVDDIKLKKCNGCYLVKYCSVKCQKEHRSQHKRACKKRAAELRDEILFKQPERTHLGDCPICCLPLPIEPRKALMMACCSKIICDGCNVSNLIREREGCLGMKCPFCRHPTPDTEEEADEETLKRVEAKDPVATRVMGHIRHVEGDYASAFEYLSKAARLGDVQAHYYLSALYEKGKGVDKDEKKEIHHLEQAAIGGQPNARYNLGYVEWNNGGRHERAIQHFIIAANMGHDDSLEMVKEGFKCGFVSKEDFAAALRGHQAAVDATKSPQREKAEVLRKQIESAKAARQM